MKYPVIEVMKNRCILHCDPTVTSGYRASRRCSEVLTDLKIRFYSPEDMSTGHDGLTYNGLLYIYMSPKTPILTDANYWTTLWNMEVWPTADYPLKVSLDTSILDNRIQRSEEGIQFDFNGNTIIIFQGRSKLDRRFWDKPEHQDFVSIEDFLK